MTIFIDHYNAVEINMLDEHGFAFSDDFFDVGISPLVDNGQDVAHIVENVTICIESALDEYAESGEKNNESICINVLPRKEWPEIIDSPKYFRSVSMGLRLKESCDFSTRAELSALCDAGATDVEKDHDYCDCINFKVNGVSASIADSHDSYGWILEVGDKKSFITPVTDIKEFAKLVVDNVK